MQIDLNQGWKYIEGAEGDEIGIPSQAVSVNLPVDLLRRHNRNYHAALGKYGSYYDAVFACFYKTLPAVSKSESVVLLIEGVAQMADVILNGKKVAHIEGAGKHYIDITEHYVHSYGNLLKLAVWAPQMAGKYVGAGICGGVKLITRVKSLFVKDDGVFATTRIEGNKALVNLKTELCDKTGEYVTSKKSVTLEAVLKNARGKRAARKIKKFRLKNTVINVCEMQFKLARFYTWTVDDPYMYTVCVTVKDKDGNVLDEYETPMGIVSRGISSQRGLVLCGRGVKLKGVVMGQDNGILGMESTHAAEEFKLSKIKEIGFNAVRYNGCPTEAVLDTLDSLGIMAFVDLFPTWSQGAFPYDGHALFAACSESDCERYVCQLRKHPSVVMYGLNADAPETYGRENGATLAKALSEQVRSLDGSRPVVINARERVPLKSELESVGIKTKPENEKAAISLGREKDLFSVLTAPVFACGDIAGYEYLYPRYSADSSEYPERLMVGSAAYPSRVFEAFDECDKNNHVVGEFLYCGADTLGYPYGKPVYEDEQLKLLPPHTSFCGALDLIYNYKTMAYYASIMLGNRGESYIAVRDPELKQNLDKAGYEIKENHNVWNWPHNLGKQMEIEVFSGGEVVALYRDGKLVGRKLAGKVNKHIATFKTEYYPGSLEAVSYHKGRECSRTVLESVTAPRAVKLVCRRKSRGVGELMFVEISVTDKEGRVVPYASREVEISIEGPGELVALGSADPESQVRTGATNVCPVYNGKALAVVRALKGGDGKITVRAVGDGMLSGKITLHVKEN